MVAEQPLGEGMVTPPPKGGKLQDEMEVEQKEESRTKVKKRTAACQ